MELAAVAQQCPDSVDESAGQGDERLGVQFAFGSYALVEGAGAAAVDFDRGQGGEVEDAAQAAVVALGSVQVAAEMPKPTLFPAVM